MIQCYFTKTRLKFISFFFLKKTDRFLLVYLDAFTISQSHESGQCPITLFLCISTQCIQTFLGVEEHVGLDEDGNLRIKYGCVLTGFIMIVVHMGLHVSRPDFVVSNQQRYRSDKRVQLNLS